MYSTESNENFILIDTINDIKQDYNQILQSSQNRILQVDEIPSILLKFVYIKFVSCLKHIYYI
jgi:hypothetical protein